MFTAGAVYVTLLTIVVTHAATGWVATVVPSLRRRDPAFELLEYRSLRDTLSATGLLQGARYVATTDWLRGAKVGHALGASAPVLVLNDDMRHFRFAADTAALRGADGLLLTRVTGTMTVDSVQRAAIQYASLFDSLPFVRAVPVLRGADTALTLGVFTTHHLRRSWHAATPP